MRIAVLADVHSNIHALERVLDAVESQRAEAILVLGDLVGYNAYPRETVAMVRERTDHVVAGNHDVETASNTHTEGTTADARSARSWTRQQLDEASLTYLQCLPPKRVVEGAYVAVHGCYLNDHHINGYVTTTMLEKNLRAVRARDDFPVVAFCGHTHAPRAGVLRGDDVRETVLSEPLLWTAADEAVLINPGSVGQPRDGDARAAYAIVDFAHRRAEVHRVSYDVAAAANANTRAGLPAHLATRLEEGR